MQRRTSRQWLPLVLAVLMLALAAPLGAAAAPTANGGATYQNPLDIDIPNDGQVESCADPSTFYDPQGHLWYTYCTADPLNDADRTGSAFNFHLIPILSSPDLVHWTYVGDAFTSRPAYATANAGLWAPEIEYYPEAASGKYHLYYTVTDTTLQGGGSAIGVATSDYPYGPWTHSGQPVIEPHGADCCGPDSRRWVYDPEVLRTAGTDYIYYGSYFGGISVRELSEDGLLSYPATQKNVAVANKYEGAEVVKKGSYYYLFVSATDCCRGPLTGYSVFVGRSPSPTGPFRDRSGVDLNDDERADDPTNARVGGSVVLSMNGNRWVGPGHNTVFQDFSGQWWTIYHAIDENDPYFEGAVGFTRRPALLDPLDWVNGWPTVRGGKWISDEPMPAPAAQPGQDTAYQRVLAPFDRPGDVYGFATDNFTSPNLHPRWDWVRPPPASGYRLADGKLEIDTQAADLFEDSNNASVLTERAPRGDYIVETRVKVNVPDEGCCFNYVQGGLVIYGDDNNYLRLVVVSIWNTRQTEFGKERFPVPAGYPRYGNTVVGPPGEWTYLRIVRYEDGAGEHYRAYTSRDGSTWERGGVWNHQLGENARIGLVAMGGSGFTATFDYVRTYTLDH